MKKKILIVSRAFFPMNSPRSFRTTELVKEFARQGHDVTLLTVKDQEHHVAFEKEHGVTIKDLGSPRFKPIDLKKGSGISSLVRKVLRRGLLQAFEYPDIELMYMVKKALEKERGYDLLISIATPHPIHWGTAWAWREKSPIADTWVADCGDPYMGLELDTFSKWFYFKYPEKAFCRQCDYITVPISDAKSAYYPEFRDKIEVIPQGFNFDEVNIDRSKEVRNDIPTFAYAGGLIPGGRDPRPFLDYITSLDKKYKFILYTKSTALVQPYLERANGRIEIRDYIPRPELLQKLSRMDFLVNFENATSLQMPSKLIDYYLTGRPVLSVDGGNIDKTAINQFLDEDYSAAYRYNGVDRYRIENVCQQFLELQERGE
ncbi:glycosyltransferase [Rhodohalobacter sp. 8-1]|uniref:glycosyltransferase n=1 Tax=Rhodohalobacter sp. 8-1 TaxID=3131972 RepID=UPI0030ED46CC